MKLLSPQQVRDAKATELTRELLRSKETETVIANVQKRMLQAEKDFNDTLARNRNIWAKEEEEHLIRLKQMEREIQILEEKKRNAMIPIDVYKEQSNVLMRDAKNAMSIVKEAQERAEKTQELLENKLDEVNDRQDVLIQAQNASQARIRGIEAQESATSIQSKLLTDRITLFTAEKARVDADILIRKKDLFLIERTLINKDNSLKRKEELLNRLKLRLEDERGVLERAFARIKHIPIEKRNNKHII